MGWHVGRYACPNVQGVEVSAVLGLRGQLVLDSGRGRHPLSLCLSICEMGHCLSCAPLTKKAQ